MTSDILHNNEFGFGANKSPILAITKVLTIIISKFNNNKKVAFALLDLKEVFDFKNPDLLLIKLKYYAIKGLPLTWFI